MVKIARQVKCDQPLLTKTASSKGRALLFRVITDQVYEYRKISKDKNGSWLVVINKLIKWIQFSTHESFSHRKNKATACKEARGMISNTEDDLKDDPRIEQLRAHLQVLEQECKQLIKNRYHHDAICICLVYAQKRL